MALAKRLERSTVDFLLTGIAPLEAADAMLALVAAITADGHVQHAERLFEALLSRDDRPDPELLREAILQTHLFAGYPRALNALAAFRRICEKLSNPLRGAIELRGEPLEADDPETFRRRGGVLFAQIYGEQAGRVDQAARSASPDLADWALVEGYGRVLSRPVLTPMQRSLCICAALVPLDVLPQLKGHVQGALNTGSTAEQLWKLFDLVGRLFNEGAELRAAKSAFEAVLGKQALDIDFEEEQQYRWS